MHKHLRLTCYALLCLLVPIGVMAQTEHKYLDRALPGSWSEEGSDFQQTLPVEDNWWRNFKDPLLDSLIEVAVKQNYSVQMAMDRIAMAKANLRSAQGSYSPTLGFLPDGHGNKVAAISIRYPRRSPNIPALP